MLCSRTETHEEEGACAHKLHVCSLQPLSVGPCWAVLGSPTKKMLMLSYQSPELRYSCSKVWLLNAAYHLWTFCLHAHATHSMVPGPLGQFDDDDLIVNRTTRATLYFLPQDHWNRRTIKWRNLATSSWDVCGSVLLQWLFIVQIQFLFTGWGFRNNKCLAGASVFWRDTAASIGV